jgi:hypothetical protein
LITRENKRPGNGNNEQSNRVAGQLKDFLSETPTTSLDETKREGVA